MEEREYQRLKELVDTGRKYHYRNFVFSGLILVLLLKNYDETLSLFLNIEFSVQFLIIFLYAVVLVFTVITIDVFKSIWQNINNEFREETPFNWFVLTGKKNLVLSGFWLVLPCVICMISIGRSSIEIDRGALIMAGVFAVPFPNYLKDFAFKIANKVDENGNKITLSIFFLYWFRLIRNALLLFLISYPLYKFFSYGQEEFNEWTTHIILTTLLVVYIIRLLWELIYKRVDKFGTRFGFEGKYENKNL